MEIAAYDLTPGFRALALLNVLVLSILFAIVFAARKRQERLERKVDLIGKRAGLEEEFKALDQGSGRKSEFAPLEFPDSTPPPQ